MMKLSINDPAASRQGIPEEFSFKSRGLPRGIKPTGGIEKLEVPFKSFPCKYSKKI
jgi:hypothetical protein